MLDKRYETHSSLGAANLKGFRKKIAEFFVIDNRFLHDDVPKLYTNVLNLVREFPGALDEKDTDGDTALTLLIDFDRWDDVNKLEKSWRIAPIIPFICMINKLSFVFLMLGTDLKIKKSLIKNAEDAYHEYDAVAMFAALVLGSKFFDLKEELENKKGKLDNSTLAKLNCRLLLEENKLLEATRSICEIKGKKSLQISFIEGIAKAENAASYFATNYRCVGLNLIYRFLWRSSCKFFSALQAELILKRFGVLGADLKHKLDEYHSTPLEYAIDMRNDMFATALINLGAKVNYLLWSYPHYSILAYAIDNDCKNTVIAAIKHGADANLKPDIDYNKNASGFYIPIMLACYKGDIDILRALIEHGADVNAIGIEGKSPLYVAYTYREKNGEDQQKDIAKLLLKNGAKNVTGPREIRSYVNLLRDEIRVEEKEKTAKTI